MTNTQDAALATASQHPLPRPLRERLLSAASGATIISALLTWILFGAFFAD